MRIRLFALCTAACFALSTLTLIAQNEPVPGPIGGPTAAVLSPEIMRLTFTTEEAEDVVRRLLDMESIIDVTDHNVTQGYIKNYMLKNRVKSEQMLGRAATYFPLFERELAAAGLPDDLKYLAITESGLNPVARSRVGAGGLWQFMPGTGVMFGLHISDDVDERGDPEKSTRAAVEFLRQEYERFGDWSLVLAAYNGGPGRVRRAIRRSGQNNYWKLRRYLPRETRNYVPAFVAAKYLYTNNYYHGLRPRPVTLDEQFPEAVACPTGIELTEVAQACDLSLDVVRSMNPHVLREALPASRNASIRVPARTAASLRTYLDWRNDDEGTNAADLVAEVRARPVREEGIADESHRYFSLRQNLPAGTTLSAFAQTNSMSEHHLALWNPHVSAPRAYDQELLVYEPRFVPQSPFDEMPDVVFAGIDARPIRLLNVAPPLPPKTHGARLPNAQYRLQRYESLVEVWQQYADSMTWSEFTAWNTVNASTTVAPGTALLVRR